MHVVRYLPEHIIIRLAEQIITLCSKSRPLASFLLLALLMGMYPAIAEDRRLCYMLQYAKYDVLNQRLLYGRLKVHEPWSLRPNIKWPSIVM